jgi:hypothetical protein
MNKTILSIKNKQMDSKRTIYFIQDENGENVLTQNSVESCALFTDFKEAEEYAFRIIKEQPDVYIPNIKSFSKETQDFYSYATTELDEGEVLPVEMVFYDDDGEEIEIWDSEKCWLMSENLGLVFKFQQLN